MKAKVGMSVESSAMPVTVSSDMPVTVSLVLFQSRKSKHSSCWPFPRRKRPGSRHRV